MEERLGGGVDRGVGVWGALFRALGGLGGLIIRAEEPGGGYVTKTADHLFALDEESLLGW